MHTLTQIAEQAGDVSSISGGSDVALASGWILILLLQILVEVKLVPRCQPV